MIKKILSSLLGLAICLSVLSQNENDSIKATKILGGYKFESNGNLLSYADMLNMMKNNPEAYQYMEKAKNTAMISNILGFAGGFMIGWPIGSAIGGGKPNWVLAGVGCGLIIISIPLVNSSNKNAIIAIDKYNSTKRNLSYWGQYDLKLCLTPNGVGVVLKF